MLYQQPIIVWGNGTREHAMAKALEAAGQLIKIVPGNAGVPDLSADWAESQITEFNCQFVVIGPEEPMVKGLADRLRARNVKVVGPGAVAAQLEGSKAFMKQVVQGLSTAAYCSFTDVDEALGYLETVDGPWVVKTSGLAAGKGVKICRAIEAAREDVIAKMSGESFGDAGREIVIEEYLEGWEVSAFYGVVVTKTSINFTYMGAACDYKTVTADPLSPNTGGMGAYSRVDRFTPELQRRVVSEIVHPSMVRLQDELGPNDTYQGFLFAGLMITEEGPKLIEYNIRLGGPETEVFLPCIDPSCFYELCLEIANGTLESSFVVKDVPGYHVVTIAAAHGYPDDPRKGDLIGGIEEAEQHATVLYGGVARDEQEQLVTSGGRVIACVGSGNTLEAARLKSLAAAQSLRWSGKHFRDDIAKL